MEVSKPKHPQGKAQFWQQEIANQKKSGLSIQEYCQERDLSYHTMGYWRRIFQKNKRGPSELIAVPVIQPKSIERSLAGSMRLKLKDFDIEFSTLPNVDWLIEFASQYVRGGRC